MKQDLNPLVRRTLKVLCSHKEVLSELCLVLRVRQRLDQVVVCRFMGLRVGSGRVQWPFVLPRTPAAVRMRRYMLLGHLLIQFVRSIAEDHLVASNGIE